MLFVNPARLVRAGAWRLPPDLWNDWNRGLPMNCGARMSRWSIFARHDRETEQPEVEKETNQ